MSATLAQTWLATVARAPGAPALIDAATGRVWSRAELHAAAQAWLAAVAPTGADSAALARRRVVFAVPNGPEWWRVFLGLQLAGAVAVPLDPTEPAETQAAVGRAIGAAWAWRDGTLGALAGGRRERAADVCLLKLTSGSTGAPKPLAFTDAQMLADGAQVGATMGIGPDDLNLAVIPLGHSYGLGNLVVPLLAQGTAHVCADSPLPHALAAAAERWRPTVFPAVPTLLRALVRSEAAPAAFASLRLVISAGAPLPAETAAAFAAKFGRRVCGFYGASETGGICFDAGGEATLAGRSVGRPMRGVALRFRRGGRFVVASAAVRGRGEFSLADRGELNALGELVLRGRAGRVAKIAGRRLDLGEVEAALRAVPGVREAHVIAHPMRPDALAAAFTPVRDPRELRATLATRLAPWKIPARLLGLDEFPVTARGKPDIRRLAALLAEPRGEG